MSRKRTRRQLRALFAVWAPFAKDKCFAAFAYRAENDLLFSALVEKLTHGGDYAS